jgi:hypothetical protein
VKMALEVPAVQHECTAPLCGLTRCRAERHVPPARLRGLLAAPLGYRSEQVGPSKQVRASRSEQADPGRQVRTGRSGEAVAGIFLYFC